ncbi:MAG: 1,4-alpha-glucan branching enzyme, partial [Actinomycetota bacterium]|nr:1,4-alpha-glucan branching enzyme [Actinomycetota bacterium]
MAEKKPASKKTPAKAPSTSSGTGDYQTDAIFEFPPLDPGLIASIVGGYHPQPHATLGQHPVDGGFVIRTVRPLAATVTAVRAD